MTKLITDARKLHSLDLESFSNQIEKQKRTYLIIGMLSMVCLQFACYMAYTAYMFFTMASALD